MGEEQELLSGSVFFNRINLKSTDMDDMGLSPPSSEMNPIIHIRKPSLSANTSIENLSKMTGVKEETGDDSRSSFHNLMPLAYQSYDNLSRLTKEKSKGYMTRSLPPSPLTTPCATPEGSPKVARHEVAERRNLDELWNSQIWFYSGFFRPSIAKTENPNTDVDKFSRCSNAGANASCKTADRFSLTKTSSDSSFFNSSYSKKKKCIITNRDMNFLAPTST